MKNILGMLEGRHYDYERKYSEEDGTGEVGIKEGCCG